MNPWRRHVSLQNPLRQRLYLSFNPFATYPRLLFIPKLIQTSSRPISNDRNIDFLYSSQKGNTPFLSLNHFTDLLSHLCSTKSVTPGFQIHAHIIKSGLLAESKVRNYLISLYAKCKFFMHAHKLIDETPQPDLVSWSSLVSGYAQNGFGKEALLVFREMHALGVKCNEFTFPSVLKGCAIRGSLRLGKQVHGTVVVSGFESDVFVANTLVVMYAKCGAFSDSKKLFDKIPEPNAVSWNAMLSCYVQNDFCEDAVAVFHEMVSSGIRPDEFSLSSILNACTSLGDYGQGMKLHGFLIKLGYETDQFSENALVDMYAKLGELEAAVAVFEAKEHPDIVSWNAIVAGCVLHDNHDLALQLVVKMKRSGIYPNIFSLPSALKACASMGYKKLGLQLHSNLIKMDIGSDLFVSVGLIDMYAKCEAMEDARKVYNRVTEKDLIAWNALISGYSQNGEDEEALSLSAQMYRDGVGFNQTTLSSILRSTASLQAVGCCRQVHALSVKSGYYSDFYVVNSLIDSYGKCGLLGEAEKNFEECSRGNLVAYTSMITAYSQYGEGEEALKLYHNMQKVGLKPDPFVCSSAVNACANLSAYEQGKQVHSQILKFGFAFDTFAANSLVNMYARCGSIEDANRAFSKIPERGIVSWSAMIGGLAQHGHGKEAIHLFNEMLKDGVSPNHVTLVSVLCACNHAGLVSEAKRYFYSMTERYGIEPTLEHYACMIDILGRAGKLDEAMELLNAMPFEANAAIWGALLGAARIHKDIELGRHAAEMLFALEPEKSGTHVLLANIYASVGMWENVSNVRRLMKDSRVKKEPGVSWIEMKDTVHTFLVGDRKHSRSEEIYAKLDELSEKMNKAGYVPIIEIDLHDVERSEKEQLLYHHSEKLAVAFGLIATPSRAPIRVKKNLRICLDCHTAFKFICKIESREIIIRDINRFHHFKDGSCSCGDYW